MFDRARDRRWELPGLAAAAAFVIAPTVALSVLAMTSLSRATSAFEREIREAHLRSARGLAAESAVAVESASARADADLRAFAAAPSPRSRAQLARSQRLDGGIVILDPKWRRIYPIQRATAAFHPSELLSAATRVEARDGPAGATEAYEAAAAAAREAGDAAGEEHALAGKARGLVAAGRMDEAAAVYRRLAEMPGVAGVDVSLPLMASLRLFEMEGSPQAREALVAACLEGAFSAPASQIRYCLGRAGASTDAGDAAVALDAYERDLGLVEAAMYLVAQPQEGERAASRLRSIYFSGRGYVAAVLGVETRLGPAISVSFIDAGKAASDVIGPLLEAQSLDGSVRFELAEGRPRGRRTTRTATPGAGPEDEEDFLAEARLPGALGFWLVRARTVSGTVVDLARSKARLLWWAVVLTAVIAVGAIVALLAWARRRSRLASLQTDFVANVTHELKTPLTGIRSLAETLQFGRITSPERAGEFVGAIVRETDRLARLINNVLDFSRLERGTARLRLEQTDLVELVRSTAEAFKASLGDDDGGRIVLETPAEPLPAVVDADSMSRAVTNLLDNAWKYSRAPREIRASLAAADGRATIAVSDNGIGIPPAQHRKIFRKFYRVDSSLSAETQGAGLGLSLVKAYAEAHGGRVDLQSKPGEGSTFTITIPLAPEDAQGGSHDR